MKSRFRLKNLTSVVFVGPEDCCLQPEPLVGETKGTAGGAERSDVGILEMANCCTKRLEQTGSQISDCLLLLL